MLFDSPCSQTWYLKWLALIPYLRRCQDNFTVFANRRQWQLKYWRWTVRNYFDTRLFHHAIHNIMYIHKFEFEHQITIMYFFELKKYWLKIWNFVFRNMEKRWREVEVGCEPTVVAGGLAHSALEPQMTIMNTFLIS